MPPTWVMGGLLGLTAVVVAAMRWRLLGVPLERDEGEYAYLGQLILQGVPPYVEAYTMKPPGVCGMYALSMHVFGQSATGIHLGLLIVNGLSAVLLFRIVRRFLGNSAASVGAATFLLTSASPSVLGLSAHATHFVVLFVLAGTLLLHSALRSGGWSLYLGAGVCFGLSVLMKSHAVLFCVFAGVATLHAGLKDRSLPKRRLAARIGVLTGGALLPVLVTFLALAWSGAFSNFWFWAVEYAGVYGTKGGGQRAITNLAEMLPKVTRGFVPVWTLVGLGAVLACVHPRLVKDRGFVLLFFFLSVATVVPGLYFREHYFITALPAFGLAAAIAVDYGQDRLIRFGWGWMPAAVWLMTMAWAVYSHGDSVFRQTPAQFSRSVYGPSPFLESLPVADYIRNNTKESDTVAILGSEPQILFYAHRRSASGFIYTYPLMEGHEYALNMQREMMREVEDARPEVLVYVAEPTSWLRRSESHTEIFRWSQGYLEHYELVGVVEILSAQETVQRWGEEAKSHRTRSEHYLRVFRRRPPS